MKRWSLPELIEAQVFGIVANDTLKWTEDDKEQIKTIEYEYGKNERPFAWVRSENYCQRFDYAQLEAVLRMFKNVPIYLSKKHRNQTHLLIVTTSTKTLGALSGFTEPKEARS